MGEKNYTDNDDGNTIEGGTSTFLRAVPKLNHNDYLDGQGGDDWIDGLAGHDTIWAGSGNDRVWGGEDNDFIGDESSASAPGHFGLDIVWGGHGDDEVRYDFNLDRTQVYGESGNDTIFGGETGDKLDGGFGNDKLYGNYGYDDLIGGYQDDELWGMDGDDTLHGDEGNDTLDGGSDTDFLFGGPGKDSLNGRGGSDWINGGSGRDYLSGGRGHDTFEFTKVNEGDLTWELSDYVSDYFAAQDSVFGKYEGAADIYRETQIAYGSGFNTALAHADVIQAEALSSGANNKYVFVTNQIHGYLFADNNNNGVLDSALVLEGANSLDSFSWSELNPPVDFFFG